MRLRTPLALAAAAALLTCAAAPRAQEQQQQSGPQKDEQVIEEFVTSRGVSFDTPGKKSSRKSGQASASSSRRNSGAGKSPSSGGVASSKAGKGGGKAGAAGKSNKAAAQRASADVAAGDGAGGADGAGAQLLKAGAGAGRSLALGYTILMKDAAGRLSVVDAARQFRTGDNIAVALEANADGYLYLFNASDGKNPEMLFPNVQLDGGANAVAAHARATFPADASLDFRFTDPPAREHLFVVFSRAPLPGVPTGEALVEYCGANVEDCAWKPTPAQWERIRGGGAKGRGVTEARNSQLAQGPAPAAAPLTLQRGLKVKREDPKPAVVRVNNSPDSDILVTEIVLAHR